MTIIEQLEDADKTLAADGYKEYSYVRIAISEAIRALRQPPVIGRFLPPNEDGYQKCANCGKWNHPDEVAKTCR